MTKFSAGKSQRKIGDPKKPTLTDLPPLDRMTHCSMREAAAYVRLSLPKIYEMVKSGALESHILGGRRFVTAQSIQNVIAHTVQLPKRPPKFTHIRRVARAAAA